MEAPSCASARSPFEIPHEDVEQLCESQGFQVLRSYLANHASFCSLHANCDKQGQDTWILHRDILHALTVPVVQLFKRASALAEAALCTHESEDLELAFAGEARGAFVWLQCFVAEEEDWCRTRGCPACVTLDTTSTESHIRFVTASSLLSTASVSSPNSSPATSTTSSPASEDPPADINGATSLTLPPLPHILPALREALSKDPFWGPGHWPYLLSRSTQLSAGIQALITSCMDLEALVSSHTILKPDTTKRNAISTTAGVPEEKGLKLKKSKLAKRQLRLKGEELEMMKRCALQCWARAAVPSKMRNELLGGSIGHRRTLTCP